MPSPNRALRVLRCIAVAVVKAGSAAALRPALGTLMADGLVEAIPDIASDLWQALRRAPAAGGVAPAELPAAIAEVAALEPAAAAVVAAEALAAEGSELAPDAQAVALAYLAEVPGSLRQSLRRPEDPSGHSVPPYQRFDRPEDLAILLPRRLSRLKAGQVLHGLELVRLVGRGGYGEVWEAVPRRVPGAASVAVKFCTDERARRQLLEHEAGVAARVMSVGRHPGIVSLLRMHLEDEVPSLEFEFVAGGDLQAVMRSNWARPEPWEVCDTFELMRMVVEPFAFMHSASPAIVHRDAKLSNILVDKDGRLRVTDFGIGGLAFVGEDVALSRRGAVSLAPQYSLVARGAYTPHYASREQMAGADAHPADDVYSLGVILYQLLTRRIDEGAPSGDWQEELADDGVPDVAIEVLKKALARTRERRFKDAGALLAAVERVCQVLNPGASSVTLSGAATKRPAPEPELVVPARPALVVPRVVELKPVVAKPAAANPAPPKPALPKVPAHVGGPLTAPNAAPIVTGIGLKMLYVAPQEFLMGSPASLKDRRKDEQQHRVRITQGYWLGETTVTQRQWRAVMGNEPWKGKLYTRLGDFVAASFISWLEAVNFCARLTEQELAAGRLPRGYRYTLPTEAEWELACRAGSTTAFCFGDVPRGLNAYAVHRGKRDGMFAHAVQSRKPNAWGFFDMHGNVWEWCLDSGSWVAHAVVTVSYRDGIEDPLNNSGPERVARGGSFNDSADFCRSASRFSFELAFVDGHLGFRPVLAARSDVE